MVPPATHSPAWRLPHTEQGSGGGGGASAMAGSLAAPSEGWRADGRPRGIMSVKPNCPYCGGARRARRADTLEFEERAATTRPDWRAELMEHSRDTGKVPTIVMGDEVVTIGWKGRG